MADEAAAAGAEGGAEGDFAGAGGGAGEEEVGDVAAGDEEHENDGAEEEFGLEGDIAGGFVAEQQGAEGEAGVGGGVGGAESGADGGEFGLGLLEGDAGFQAGKAGQVVGAAHFRFRFLIVGEGLPGVVDFRETDTARHDADDDGGFAVDDDLFAEDVLAAAEVLAPGVVGEEGDGRGAGGGVGADEVAAEKGSDAEGVEAVGADPSAHETDRAFAAGEDKGTVPGDEGAVEGGGLGGEVPEIGHRKFEERIRFADGGGAEADQRTLVVEERQGPQEQGVEEREDGGRRGDAERQREQGHDGEAGGLGELAEGEAEVGEHEYKL